MKFSPKILLSLAVLTMSAQAQAYKLIDGPKWDPADGPVGYYIDAAGSEDVTDGSDIEAIKQGFKNWECVLCSSLQFRYDGEAPFKDAAQDGYNIVYWIEREEDWPFGEGTLSASILGICSGGGGPNDSDIVFNGFHHTWSTTDPVSADADIGSVAAHEQGHFTGLDHPCTDESESDCLPTEQAIMNPTYPGGIWRTPNEDDRAGICAMYPPGKDTCEGGKVIGEKCAKNCECEDGLGCIMGFDGQRYCAPSCQGDATHCPRHMVCMLAARSNATEGGPAPGACVKYEDASDFPASAACERDAECRSRNCGLAPALGRTACVQSCASVDQCEAGYACRDNRCVLPAPDRGVPCPEDPVEEPGCGCQSTGNASLGLGLVLLFGLLALRRRRLVYGFMGLVALLIGQQAQATVVEAMDLDRMIEIADVVVQGRVVAINTRELKPNGLIVRDITVAVDAKIIGEDCGETLTFMAPGGELADRSQLVPGASQFAVGEEVVMFLSHWRDTWVQIAVGVGKFNVQRQDGQPPQIVDAVSGVATYGRDLSGQSKMMGLRQAVPSLALEDFVRELRGRADFSR